MAKHQNNPMQDILKVEHDIALWCDQVIRDRHTGWSRRLAEHSNVWSRIYAYLFVKLNGYSSKRQRHQSMLGGKGFRKGSQPVYLTAISCDMSKWGKVIASKRFPINVRVYQ